MPPSSGGVIGACEWIGPHDDIKLGLHDTARYYYPGRHEPGTVTEVGLPQESVRCAPGRPAGVTRQSRRGRSGLWVHGLQREERDRARAPQDGLQGKVASSSQCRCCVTSRKLADEVVKEESAMTPWPGRSTCPSRSFRHW